MLNGSYGAITGASTAATRYTPISVAARTAGWCRRNRRAAPETARAGAGASQDALTVSALTVTVVTLPQGNAAELVVPDAWVDYPVPDVHQRVDDDVAAGHEQDRRLEHRVVPGEDRVHGILADPGNGEDLLDDQRAPEQLAGLRAHQREHRDEGVLQRVSSEHRPLVQTLR